ncbi:MULTISPECIES: glycosyltransferase family 4 protein [unclassified Sphingobacterium]|uniref:glycosyltransferase family 4 protein n=1 Tax=unclassified Sphingobacterium TaxID=2609468 RepID=UPI0020C493EF|nr:MULTISPECIES: glycosyltransferase family 4 protein [unclassified Sphingobacterium]
MIKIIRTSTVPESLYLLLKGQLKYLSSYFDVVAISSDGELLAKTSLREEVKVVPVEMSRGINIFKDVISLIQLYYRFRKEKPIIVHSITPKAGLLSMLAAKMAGVPIRVHTFTGLVFPSKKGILKLILIYMDKLLCWAATNVYPEGNGVKEDLVKYLITLKPLRVLGNGNVNGINLDFFNPSLFSNLDNANLRKSLLIDDDDFVFVFVGRLVSDKGVNELVQAFSELNLFKTKLLLVGKEEEKLDPLHAETKIVIDNNPNIIKLGFQNDVRPYYAISNVLVFPSYREGFPNVVIQAGAMGLPSIVTDINGNNEIIKHRENGIIIPVKDKGEVLKSMKLIMEDKVLCQYLTLNARKLVSERYEQNYVWDCLLKEYKELLKINGFNNDL